MRKQLGREKLVSKGVVLVTIDDFAFGNRAGLQRAGGLVGVHRGPFLHRDFPGHAQNLDQLREGAVSEIIREVDFANLRHLSLFDQIGFGGSINICHDLPFLGYQNPNNV